MLGFLAADMFGPGTLLHHEDANGVGKRVQTPASRADKARRSRRPTRCSGTPSARRRDGLTRWRLLRLRAGPHGTRQWGSRSTCSSREAVSAPAARRSARRKRRRRASLPPPPAAHPRRRIRSMPWWRWSAITMQPALQQTLSHAESSSCVQKNEQRSSAAQTSPSCLAFLMRSAARGAHSMLTLACSRNQQTGGRNSSASLDGGSSIAIWRSDDGRQNGAAAFDARQEEEYRLWHAQREVQTLAEELATARAAAEAAAMASDRGVRSLERSV